MMPEEKVSQPRASLFEWTLMGGISVLLVGLSWLGFWRLSLTEALGFATGGICVWLVVREDVLNWPVGIANNLLFFILFLTARLYADMVLQVVYLALGAYGWWNWIRGGDRHRPLEVSRTTGLEWIILAMSVPLTTWALAVFLTTTHDASPLWDSLTTVLSLAAQYLLTRKRLENWLFWILADIVYVPLYLSRGLTLTALLYGLFLVMCLIGFTKWIRHFKSSRIA